MSKKVLSIVLALALALSCFAVSAFAMGMGYEEEDSTYTQAWALSEPQEGANGWYADVTLTADYSVGAIQFALEFSDANITIADVVVGDAFLDDYNADVAFDSTGASNIVAIIPNPFEDAAAAVDASAGVTVCTVYFTVPEGAAGTVQIADDAKTATNPGGTLFAARMTDGTLATGSAIVGQATTIDTPARNIGAVAAPAELVKKASAEAGILIDRTHTFGGSYTGVVFGFTQAANNTFMNTNYLNNAFEASNGGSLAYSRSIGTTGYGTGTVITVKNADGSVAETFVVVIFGDCDGNGLININDIKGAANAVSNSSAYPNNSVQRMAANCQNVAAAAMMHTLNVNDVKVVASHVSGTKIAQSALATKMASITGTYYK